MDKIRIQSLPSRTDSTEDVDNNLTKVYFKFHNTDAVDLLHAFLK